MAQGRKRTLLCLRADPRKSNSTQHLPTVRAGGARGTPVWRTWPSAGGLRCAPLAGAISTGSRPVLERADHGLTGHPAQEEKLIFFFTSARAWLDVAAY